MDRFKRRPPRHAVGERVERALLALAETLRRRVAVERDEKGRPQRARLGKIGDVPAMQDIEHAIGKYQGPRAGAEARRKLLRRGGLMFGSSAQPGAFDKGKRRRASR